MADYRWSKNVCSFNSLKRNFLKKLETFSKSTYFHEFFTVLSDKHVFDFENLVNITFFISNSQHSYLLIAATTIQVDCYKTYVVPNKTYSK